MESAKTPSYTLMEESVLMCLRQDGSVSSGPVAHKMPAVAVVTSIMLELCLKDRLICTTTSSGAVFSLRGTEPTGDDLLDDVIQVMKDKNDQTIDEWFKNVNGTLIFTTGIKDLVPRVYKRLCDKKVLTEKKGMLGASYPFDDLAQIGILTQHLREILHTDPLKVDDLNPRDLCLIGVFHALDKPFASKPGNALDINRIFPDKEEKDKVRKNLEVIFQFAKTEESDVAAVSKAATQAVLKRMLRIALLGAFNVFLNL